MVTAVSVGSGASLLALLAVDVFMTVFHAQGRAGPLTHRQNRLLWRLFRSVRARPGMLALAGPLMVVLMLTVWTLLLTAGFALVYYPWITDFHVSTGDIISPALAALYYSGYTGSTLGLGDLTAPVEILRVVTVVQAFSGFAVITVSITYLLATYSALQDKRALAAGIAGYFRANDPDSQSFRDADGFEVMAGWSEDIAGGLRLILQAHFQYPVLHYFRSTDRTTALVVQLDRLLQFRDDHRGVTGAHPSYRALFDAVHQYIEQMNRYFVPDGDTSIGEDEVQDALQRVREYLLY